MYKIRKGKIKPNGSEHSRAIQEALFDKGYKWFSQMYRPDRGKYIDYKYSFIFIHEDGSLTKSVGSSCNPRPGEIYEYNMYNGEELSLKDIINSKHIGDE